uniref:Cathepsin L-like n=1 Tax=Plectus sambesii TaxID=2011161 RepID=A0A914WAQ5_9BILA
MKVLIVFCLAVGALAASVSHIRHRDVKAEQTEFQEWQLLMPAKENTESTEETNESVEQTSELVEDINESAEETNQWTEENNESTEDINESTEDVNEWTVENSESVEENDESTEDTNESVEENNEWIEETSESTEDIDESAEEDDESTDDNNELADWEAYKEMHGKVYTSESEDSERLQIFLTAQQTIREHNEAYARGEKDFYLGLNHLSDLLPEEYNILNGFIPLSDDSLANDNYTTILPPINVKLPRSVDWRRRGYVTPVKNQGRCGSCWSFGATGALEGQTKRKTGRLVSLSEQNLVDCSGKYGNHGCKGGNAERAFQYIRDNRGIDTERSYPYEGIQSRCRFNRQFVGANARGFVTVYGGDERRLQHAVATVGPVAVAINASPLTFRNYKGGVHYHPECSPRGINHAVLVVGYGSLNGKDYWLVKNSWGTGWGDRGYIRMARNRGNNCGIASYGSYPQI